MADSNSDMKDQEGGKLSEGEKSEPSNSEQPTASTEEGQSAEPVGSDKETSSSEQPKDNEAEKEGKDTQEEGATEAQSETVEGEKAGEGEEGVKEQGDGQATQDSSDENKPSDTEQQPAGGNEATPTEDEQKADVARDEGREEVSSDGGQVAMEDGEEGERDKEKPQEPMLDDQRKGDEVEGEGEVAESDQQAEMAGESSVQDTDQSEAGQQWEEGEMAEEGAKVKWEESGPTGEESGVVGMETLNEPLPDILEEDEELEPIDREELLASTKEVILEQERLKSVSALLQHKIAEYLAKKKTEERPDPGRNVTDQEKRYKQCMAALEMYESDLDTMQQRAELQDAQLLALREQKLAQVRKAAEEFADYKKGITTTAVHSRAGRRLRAQEVEQFQAAEDKKESELTLVRLENIKLQNKISKLESQIKEKEQLAEGLHMIDFEQLKINNVDLNEKIEERNEDILKLRKKVTSTVQVLTHVKEKLQFLQVENGEKRTALRNIDEIVAKKRDHLTRMKQARDALRVDNQRLKQRGGLVGHPALLGDFEQRKDQNDELRVVLEKLQQRHSELTVACDGFRKKVEQAKTIHPRNL